MENLNGTVLRLVTNEIESVSGVVDEKTGVLTGQGIVECIIRDLQHHVNFRVTLLTLRNQDPSSPAYFQNGIGKVLRDGDADVGIGYFFVTQPRVRISSPLTPIFTDSLVALFVQPESHIVRNIFVDCFQWPAFLCSGVLLFLICLVSRRLNVSKTLLSAFKNLFDTAFNTISLVAQSGYCWPTRENFGRIFLCGSYLSVFVFILYSANLITFLIQPVYPIKTFHDLVDHGYTFFGYPYARTYFPETLPLTTFQSDDEFAESLTSIFTLKHSHIDISFNSAGGTFLYTRLKETIKFSKNDDQVCHAVSSTRFLISNVAISTSFYVAKNQSELKNVLNRSISKIRETGLLIKHMKSKNMLRSDNCPSDVKPSYREDLGMEDVLSGFMILLAGLLIAFGVLGIEIVNSTEKYVFSD